MPHGYRRVKLRGRSVRMATEADIDACNRVCCAVHGHDRRGEWLDAIRQGTATVVECGSRITGYATIVGFFGHTVGESNGRRIFAVDRVLEIYRDHQRNSDDAPPE